jgi:hypothetical protein
MDRIGNDITSRLFAYYAHSEELQPKAVTSTYLNKEIEEKNRTMMTKSADVRMQKEMTMAMARQVSVTFKRALAKQGCMFGFRLTTVTQQNERNYVSLVFPDRIVTLNVHKVKFAKRLRCPLRSFVFRSIAKIIESTQALVDSNVKAVEVCVITLYRNFCDELPLYRMPDDISDIKHTILEWAKDSSHVIETTLDERTPLQIKLKVHFVYYTVYAIHAVAAQLGLKYAISEQILEVEYAEQIYACFCRTKPITFGPLNTVVAKRVQNAIMETLPVGPRRNFILRLIDREANLGQIMKKYIEEWLLGTVSHLDACTAVCTKTLVN